MTKQGTIKLNCQFIDDKGVCTFKENPFSGLVEEIRFSCVSWHELNDNRDCTDFKEAFAELMKKAINKRRKKIATKS